MNHLGKHVVNMDNRIRDLKAQLAEERAHADELAKALDAAEYTISVYAARSPSMNTVQNALAAHRERRRAEGGQG